jgi:hypothetical protein
MADRNKFSSQIGGVGVVRGSSALMRTEAEGRKAQRLKSGQTEFIARKLPKGRGASSSMRLAAALTRTRERPTADAAAIQGRDQFGPSARADGCGRVVGRQSCLKRQTFIGRSVACSSAMGGSRAGPLTIDFAGRPGDALPKRSASSTGLIANLPC